MSRSSNAFTDVNENLSDFSGSNSENIVFEHPENYRGIIL